MKPVIRRCWSGTHKAWGWAVTSGWTTAWGASVRSACSEFQKVRAINSYYTDKQGHGGMMTTEATPGALGSNDQLGPALEPAGYRTRYRSEPGMIGHYPWTYADQSRRRRAWDRMECEYEDLYTADQVRALLTAERERWQRQCAGKRHDGCAYLAICGSVCNKCGRVA